MICKACGYDNSEDSQFCSQCGFPLSIEEGNLVSDTLTDDVDRLGLKNGAIPYVIDGLKTGEFPSSLRADRKTESEGVMNADGNGESDNEDAGDGAEAEASDEAQDVLASEPEDSGASEEVLNAEDASGAEGAGFSEDAGESEDSQDSSLADDEGADDGELDDDEHVVEDDAEGEDQIKGKHVKSADAEQEDSGVQGSEEDSACDNEALTQALEPADDAVEANAEAEAEADVQAMADDIAETAVIGDGRDEADDGETIIAHDAESSDGVPSSIEGKSEPLGAEAIPEFLRERKSSNEDIYETLKNLPDTGVDTIPPLQATAVMPPISTKGAIRYSTSDRDKKDAHRRRMPKLPMFLAAIVAVLALFGVVQFLSNATFGVEVPDVVGMSSDTARYELLNAGFQVDTKSQLTQDNFGIVLSSDPAAGTKKKTGSTVTITVSASRTIPDVIGMDVEAAKTKLQEEGAELVMVVSKPSNQPENTVISVEPESGEAFNPQDEITLTVASHATVPNVVGMQEEEAKAAVEEAGYVPEVKWADSDADAGTVISTTPESGTNANLSSTVEIYVASPGPRDIYHLLDFYDATPENDSLYLQWKGFTVAGSYTYGGDDGKPYYASQMWQAEDGTTISFTPVPYSPDAGLSYEDYLAQGFGFEGVRLYIPSNSSLSMTTDISVETVQAYADACGFGTPEDTCSVDDVEADNGVSGKDLGLPAFICSQGKTDNGYIWTVLVTEKGTYIGCGPESCYEGMDPICDDVAINEMYS